MLLPLVIWGQEYHSFYLLALVRLMERRKDVLVVVNCVYQYLVYAGSLRLLEAVRE